MGKRHLILGVAALLACGGAVGIIVYAARSQPEVQQSALPKTEKFTDKVTGLSFVYPESLARQVLTPQDTKDKVLFRATEAVGGLPLLVTARYETGLRAAANVAKVKTLDLVLSGAEQNLPKRFPDYKKEDMHKFDRAGYEAAELIYSYTGPSGERVRQKLLLITKDPDTAAYITAQAREDDYSDLDSKVFSQIFESTKFE